MTISSVFDNTGGKGIFHQSQSVFTSGCLHVEQSCDSLTEICDGIPKMHANMPGRMQKCRDVMRDSAIALHSHLVIQKAQEFISSDCLHLPDVLDGRADE